MCENRAVNVVPRPEFPRPDMERKDWVNLNGIWEFSFDEDRFDQKICVPFCYQSAMSGIGVVEEHSVVWYRREFDVDMAKCQAGRLLLKFGAVDYGAEVWVNGTYVGMHEGGHSSFELDITEHVKDMANTLTIKVSDYPNTDKPRGKQTWTGEKFGCWYTPTTGIWQTVWLEYVGSVYVKRIKITPDIRNLTALCEIYLSSMEQQKVTIVPEMLIDQKEGYDFGEQTIVCRNGYGKAVLAFPDFDLRRHLIYWTPENPNLIPVNVTVCNGNSCDEVKTYFGMRTVGSHNGKFLLNDEFYYEKLVLDQGYWTESLLTPPSDEAIRKDIELTKAMGFNGARKHQKIEDPRYYYWADRMGLLVWGELPSSYEYNDNMVQNASREMVEFVLRDYNHPSIVTWVPINESWGVRNIQINKQQQDFSRMMIYLIKSLDQIRPVSGNDGWEQVTDTDICAVHDYSIVPSNVDKYENMDEILRTIADSRILFAEGESYQGQPIMMTEYGGIAFQQEGEEGWGYLGKVKDQKEFIERLHPVTSYLRKSGKFTGYCYTQLTDVMQEVNGLLKEDRSPKVPIEELHKIFGE